MKFRVISVCLAGILCLGVPVNVSAAENENPQNSVSDCRTVCRGVDFFLLCSL